MTSAVAAGAGVGAAAPAERRALRLRDDRFLDRDLSRLDYDARVLAHAEDSRLPLLERVRFLAIFSRGLDDFHQLRAARLSGIAAHRASLLALQQRGQLLFLRMRAELSAAGIRIVDPSDLSERERAFLRTYFETQALPLLTPVALDRDSRPSQVAHFSLNVSVGVRELRGSTRYMSVEVPSHLPRLLPLPGGRRFLPIEHLVGLHLHRLFAGQRMDDWHFFRVTRDNDIEVEEAADLLSSVRAELDRQVRGAQPVRLELCGCAPLDLEAVLMRRLRFGPAQTFRAAGLLDLGRLQELADLDRPELKLPAWRGFTPRRLRGGAGEADVFHVLRRRDLLFHHPYESFDGTVATFLHRVAEDENVTLIKQTLYRTSGPVSPIANAMVAAARAGKQVVALVEVRARGDEKANMAWARVLEAAGVQVAYGPPGLKTHAKVTLVVRKEGRVFRRYVHVATGNYNPVTAQGYEDIGVLSADPDLGEDVAALFNYLTGHCGAPGFRRMLVAPLNLRSRLTELIEREGRPGGAIFIKVNNLTDPAVIDSLYAASRAGASVDLVVRGMCRLRPGVPGLSDRIRVRSVLGRFLEHSRIFGFGAAHPAFYIGSADLMERNLDRRVEALVPVLDRSPRRRLAEVVDALLSDRQLAWRLQSDGSWLPPAADGGGNVHELLIDGARSR